MAGFFADPAHQRVISVSFMGLIWLAYLGGAIWARQGGPHWLVTANLLAGPALAAMAVAGSYAGITRHLPRSSTGDPSWLGFLTPGVALGTLVVLGTLNAIFHRDFASRPGMFYLAPALTVGLPIATLLSD